MNKYLKEVTLLSGFFAFGWVLFGVFCIIGFNFVIYGISTLFVHFIIMICFTIMIGLMRPVDVKK